MVAGMPEETNLPEMLSEQYRLLETLPVLGPARQFMVAPRGEGGGALRVYYLPQEPVTAEREATLLRQAARECRGLVHPHLCRVVAAGEGEQGGWVAESAPGAEPLVASWRREESRPEQRLRQALDVWEALAYVHLAGLSHGCVCPGVLWAGAETAYLGGLAGIGALARSRGRAVALGDRGGENAGGRSLSPWQQDVHDLAATLLWLADWPEPVEQVLHEVMAHPRPASEVAQLLVAAQREAQQLAHQRAQRAASTERVAPLDRQHTDQESTTEAKMVRTARQSDNWLQTLRALVWGVASTLLTLAVLLGLTAGIIMFVFGPTGEPTRVPEVTGMEVAEAQARLESSGLKGIIGRESHDVEIPEGNVISTLPYAGKLVRAGREVQLVVSLGPREVKVPKVTGLTLNLAKEKLTTQDLTLGTVTTQSDKAEVDTVLKQEPVAGTLVGRNAEVKLVISGGPDYGTLETAGGVKYLFRTLTLTVPEGPALQLVKVSVSGRQRDNSFYERLSGPGEAVEVELYGRRGDRVQVTIEGKQVFSERL